MLLWVKTAAVLGLSILLMGSKLIIQVPEGGSVVSSSGLVACAAGETCTVDLSAEEFAETFTAVAEPGYAFDHWRDRAGAVCRGSRDAYCEELDNGPFSDFSESRSRLRQGATMTMTPAFTARGHTSAQAKPRFSISSFHTTRYYQVKGNTLEEIWAQLHSAANPLAIDHKAGTRPLGHASFEYKYNYQGAYAANASSCRVESGKLEFRFETVLPRLASAAATSEQLERRWRSFQEHITEHEAGHHAIYRQLVTQLPQVMTDLGEVPCSDLDERVSVAVAQAADAIRQASAEYDEHYGGETSVASSL
jgi:predicted secreted Zn-dependent protease